MQITLSNVYRKKCASFFQSFRIPSKESSDSLFRYMSFKIQCVSRLLQSFKSVWQVVKQKLDQPVKNNSSLIKNNM